MLIDRWVDKEDEVHIYNGILLSHKKEWICVSFSEVDELRACYRGKVSHEEKNKYHVLMYIYFWILNSARSQLKLQLKLLPWAITFEKSSYVYHQHLKLQISQTKPDFFLGLFQWLSLLNKLETLQASSASPLLAP